MTDAGVGAFPFPLDGRIPNFRGSNDAARRLSEAGFWKAAGIVKANPDAPQRRARELAVADGKRLFMAVPRLRDTHPFREIVPDKDTPPREAVTLKGSQKHGQPRLPEELPEIDLILTGSVAVHRDGRRLGKGGGYSDLEFALARHAGKITDNTVIATTVHPLQVTEEEIPFEEHDLPLDYIVTPEEVVETKTVYKRPVGIVKEILSEKYRDEIPVLNDFVD